MKLGLIGGLALGAGIHYYKMIAEEHKRAGKVLSLFLGHADFQTTRGLIEAGNRTELAAYLCGLLESCSRAGATIGAVAAATPHVCLEELRAMSPIPIVDLPSALNEKLSEGDVLRVSLFGTRLVVESDIFGYLNAATIVKPAARELDDVHAIYTQLAERGYGTAQQRERLAEIADRLFEQEQVDAVVLAGTDFCSLYAGEPPEYRAIDAGQAHIEEIVQRMLAG